MLPIQRKISGYNYSSRNGSSIQYIVLHYTGNTRDTALGNANYFNTCNRDASAHYFVDDSSIYQVVEDYNSSWAVGDGKGKYGITNRNSISIEMCTSENYLVSEKTENNTVELVQYLMKKYGIDINHVVRHYDASKKQCPNWSANNWQRWIKFKEKVSRTTKYNIGWNQDSKGWWYSYDGTNYYKDCWKEIKGEWYSFNPQGYARQSCWLQYKGYWYWLKEDCKMARNEWVRVEDDWYYFGDGGGMYVNCYTPDGYYVDEDGAWDTSVPRK